MALNLGEFRNFLARKDVRDAIASAESTAQSESERATADAAIARLDQLRVDHIEEATKLRAKCDEQIVVVAQRDQAAEEARDELQCRQSALAAASFKYRSDCDAQHQKLIALNKKHVPAIQEFCDSMSRLEEQERKEPARSENRAVAGVYHRISGAPVTETWSDYGSRVRRLEAIRAAWQAARDLPLSGFLNPEILEKRFAKLKATIPPVIMEHVN